jgi:hypothetical protein
MADTTQEQANTDPNVANTIRVERHVHNHLDIEDWDSSIPDISDMVNKTDSQTVNGVKTFGSIPVLPASDPTTDNQAVRKAYLLAQIVAGSITAVASDAVKISDNDEESSSASPQALAKRIQVFQSGTYRVAFKIKIGSNLNTYAAFIARNNGVSTPIQIGTNRTGSQTDYQTYSQDFYISDGDYIELWAATGGAGTYYIKDFQVSFDLVQSPAGGVAIPV